MSEQRKSSQHFREKRRAPCRNYVNRDRLPCGDRRFNHRFNTSHHKSVQYGRRQQLHITFYARKQQLLPIHLPQEVARQLYIKQQKQQPLSWSFRQNFLFTFSKNSVHRLQLLAKAMPHKIKASHILRFHFLITALLLSSCRNHSDSSKTNRIHTSEFNEVSKIPNCPDPINVATDTSNPKDSISFTTPMFQGFGGLDMALLPHLKAIMFAASKYAGWKQTTWDKINSATINKKTYIYLYNAKSPEKSCAIIGISEDKKHISCLSHYN